MYWLLLLGLVALVLGAEVLVNYGTKLAKRLHISPLIIGLTVVSIGTSAPEIAVGIDAVSRSAGSLALGNIVGTNIVNILLILGLAAAIRPIILGRSTIYIDLPMMLLSAVLLFILAFNGTLTTIAGVILLAMSVVYMVLIGYVARHKRREHVPVETDELAEQQGEPVAPLPKFCWKHFFRDLILLLVGLAIIVLGAEWLVDGAVAIAYSLGVSETVVGLTVVAIGTSAPELATTISATVRGKRAIAIGNLIGSSTLNTTLVLGIALMFGPHAVQVDPGIIRFDLPIMVGVMALCVPVFLSARRITRLEGILMVCLYAAYLGFVIWSTVTGIN
jgi:cation:H+ antiporter